MTIDLSKAWLITANGDISLFEPKNGVCFDIETIKLAVGGNIESLSVTEGVVALVNGKANNEGLPVNVKATQFINQYQGHRIPIVGNTVITPISYLN